MTPSTSPYHPWRELRAAGDDLIYEETDLPSGNAWWVPKHRVILMRPGLRQVERRCALAHELAHRDLGHSGQCRYSDSVRQATRAESDADAWAARKLITVEALASVLVWTDDRDDAAADLWVTRRILDARLAYMHLGERLAVRAAVRRQEGHHDDDEGDHDSGGHGSRDGAAGRLRGHRG